jgi:hypothetical protein
MTLVLVDRFRARASGLDFVAYAGRPGRRAGVAQSMDIEVKQALGEHVSVARVCGATGALARSRRGSTGELFRRRFGIDALHRSMAAAHRPRRLPDASATCEGLPDSVLDLAIDPCAARHQGADGEAVEIKRAVEPIEKAAAKERQRSGLKKGS